MSGEIVLYDLTARDGKCWTPNPWKTRMLLNYKGLPYTTHWVEYPEIEPTLKPLGVPPNTDGNALWSIPAAKFPDGSIVMDSLEIAKVLEKQYPSTSVHLDDPIVSHVQDLCGKARGALTAVWQPRVPRNLLNPSSQEYFQRTRAERHGMSLDEFEEKAGGKTEKPWEEAKPWIEKLVAVMKQHPEGPFVLGKTFSYADIIMVAGVKFFERIEPGMAEKWLGMGGEEFRGQWEACRKWLERDDH